MVDGRKAGRNWRNLIIPGISYDGGYQEYMVAPVQALAAIPESLDAAEAVPLLCADRTLTSPSLAMGRASAVCCLAGLGGGER
jgi:D-arabinose 1-dehydrogenase-like Zn-dependent alcohol dehydrogenase